MVVRPTKGLLCLTLQTDHANACREMAAAWGNDRFAPVTAHRESVLSATAMHDEGWVAWERRPRIRPDNSRPYSFLEIPQAEHTEIYSRGVALTRAVDPYAALLVSLHGVGLYNGRYGHMPHIPVRPTDPGAGALIQRFMTEQAAVQAELIAELKPDLITLWTYYRWLQAWDGISLMTTIFAPEPGREIAIGRMPHHPGVMSDEPMVLQGAGPETWALTAWPFAQDRLELTWPVRYVADKAYESDEEFQEALAAAPIESQSIRLIPA